MSRTSPYLRRRHTVCIPRRRRRTRPRAILHRDLLPNVCHIPFYVRYALPTHTDRYFFFCKHNSRCFRTALPVFKIALKYKASYVIEALASQLEQDWPQTLEEWDAAQGKDGPFVDPFEDFASDRQTQNRTAPVAVTEPASAIQVARIANLPGILSIAYYQLSRVSHSSVGWQNIVSLVDAKDHRREKKGSVRDHGRGRWDEWSLLSKGDLRRLAVGKEGLAKHMHCFQRHLPQELVLHPSCAKGWSMCVPMKSEDPLAHLLELCSEEVLPDGNTICSDCRSLINKRGREERERVWALLSQLFCTPGYPGMS